MLSTDSGGSPEQPISPRAAAPASGGGGGSPGAGPGGTAGPAPGSSWQPADGGPPAAPSVSLPAGGGAIRDIGEKFAVNAATGTASLTVPVATSPGRAGFGPSLSLSYDSGAGNGPFGLGWKVSLPAITRKTDKGLPRYIDDPDQDTFILSGAEDLVPVRAERDGGWHQVPERRTAGGHRYAIQRYRPRIEGLFARIERWRDLDSGQAHWRTITPANVTTIYGATAASRIADPADPSRVFSWLICESYDDTGNAAVYEYLAEDSAAVDAGLASERNRTERSRSAGRYPKRIRYGNRLPWPPSENSQGDDSGQERDGHAYDSHDANDSHEDHDSHEGHDSHEDFERGHRGDWMFEIVFDYGDHDERCPRPESDRAWLARPDPFSTYRPGFEVRTYRRCHRVLMFHHFPDEPDVGAGCLVCSTDLTYQGTGGGGMTTVASVAHTGYRRRPGGHYHAESLPPLELRYSQAIIGADPRDLGAEALQNLPAGIDSAAYQWIDLDGEGLSGILARQGGAWFYKANLGDGRFAAERMLAAQPAMAGSGSRPQLLDLAGDGHLDLVELDGPMPGFYERTGGLGCGEQAGERGPGKGGPGEGGCGEHSFAGRTSEPGWRSFRPFRSRPDISWNDPQLRMVDLDGDGIADVLITGDDAFTWYPSLGYQGFGDAMRTFHPWGEEQGPRLMFVDPEQTIYLADMSGDGLSDLVRVRNGEICYWPNTGFGRFGAKVTMDRCPWLDQPGHFDQRRVRLADVDGSGTADLVYLHADGTRLYLNQSGNGFAEQRTVPQGFPRLDSLAHVIVADLLGRGTGCLVWSSPLPSEAGRQLRYVDLMTAGKPYLLTEVVNNLGAETRISYAPSTQFYLADQATGRPWITRLPFPVQVVERVETIDRINRNRFTTRHAYHHGYFDGFEREFRGFGMVEQWDTEELAVLETAADRGESAVPEAAQSRGESAVPAAAPGPGEFANLDPATDLPPVLTRTWLHTGVFPGEERVTRLYASEYHRQPGGGDPDLPDTALPGTLRLTGERPRPWRLSRTEAREACRALKGAPLRQEVYALDGTRAQHRPYAVTEHNYTIELLQPATEPRPDGPQNYHAVFLTHARETVIAHYERALYPADGGLRADPRITHDLVLESDDYGNPLHTASAAYGRRIPDPTFSREDHEAQRRLRLTCTENGYTNAVHLPDAHRTPLPAETRTFEVVGLRPGNGEPGQHRPGRCPPAASRLFGFEELRDALAGISAMLPFQDWDADPAGLAARARRLITRTRVRYRRDDLSGALPFGVLEPLALPYRSYRQAFTSSLVADLYSGQVSDRLLTAAGYVRDGDAWLLPSGRVFYSPDDGDGPAAELRYARRHFFLPHRFRDPFGNTTALMYDRYDLLAAQVRDALGNLVTAGERDAENRLTVGGNDYRVLQPRLVSDANRNRAAVAFDTLGRVCGSAEMGKPEERLGDSLDGFEPDLAPAAVTAYFADPFAGAHRLLGEATTRIVYDLDAYRRTRNGPQPQPGGVATLARETHRSDLAPGERTRIRHSFSYSDGFGRAVQHKGQAAAGPVTDGGPGVARRWIGSGWTVFNNKGLPVRTYEPFFTATQEFEFARAVGVSSVLFYDPGGRVIAVLHPDGGYDKATFDPWHQSSWDAADTVLLDPRHDPDVRGYSGRYLAGLSAQPDGWATWYERRITGALGQAERRTAEQTALHADTPARGWVDAAGRTFLAVAHNRVPRNGELTDQYCRTRSVLDIQGNEHEARDALDRAVMRYGYAMLGGQLIHAGMDTGGSQLLPDVTGKPVYIRNSRGFELRTEYDALRRPVRTHVAGPGITGQALQARTEYGDQLPEAEARNLRTRVARQYDGGGLTTSETYDFKGNLLAVRKQFAAGYREVVDWSSDVPLEEREYPGRTSYDALNRPVSTTTPDGSVLLPRYDPAGMLDRLDGRVRGAADATTFVAHLDYNARGQHTLISYGNGTSSAYAYDPLTFRLVSLRSLRGTQRLQDLRYNYDPVGNPTLVRDYAQPRVFFRNRVADPFATYSYDALYRLAEATGREHLGHVAGGALRPVAPSATDAPRTGLPQPGDGTAMARYIERYVYDEVGNLLQMAHRSADAAYGGWTRDYRYSEPSLLEPRSSGNRLTGAGPARSVTGPQRFRYDEQGNTLAMPQIPQLSWDYGDRLHATARQAANGSGAPGTTYYVYDATGQRVRKVTERAASGASAPSVQAERFYLGTFEIYREYGNDGAVTLEREALHILADKHRLALVETRTAGTDRGPGQLIRYQLANHLDSSVLELDQHAQVITYEEYYAYGSTSYQAVRARTETPKRYRFTGRERDTETGLYYHGARYYAPWLARWTSCDPAGLVDGPNLYRYARDNPVRLTDAAGTEPDDPTAPPTLNGVGLTIGGGKVRLGPLTAPASGPCDELYAACGSWTLSPGTPPDSAGSGSGQAGGTDDDDIPGDPFGILHALKTYSPAPASDLAWRKSNPSVDPDPFGEGFLPKDPAGQYSIADHALAHHKLKGEGTPYISASRKPGGADTMNGEPFAIDVQAVKDAGTKVHETSDIAHALDQAAKDHPLIKPVHVEWWKKAQQTTEGVPVKPGDPLRGEILFEGPVPPGAIVTTGRQAVKYLGRGLMVAAVAMTVWDLGKSVVDSFKQGSPLPLAREAIRQGATWGTMAVGAEVGAEIGSLIAPPIGTIVGGIVGGIAGGLAGYIEGSWLADLF